MITFQTDFGPCRIVESLEELPEVDAEDLFADAELTSFDKDEMALYPYQGHRVCGIALTWDKLDGAYYIPIRHTNGNNLNPKLVMAWLQKVLKKSKRWINHNLKFDAHAFAVDGVFFDGEWVDTLQTSRMLDTERFTHSLKPLCRDWCSLPMDEEEEIKSYLKGIKSKNYGDIPIDMLGRYACMDVIGNRTLYHYLNKHWPDSMLELRKQEYLLTPVLFDMEREGMRGARLEIMKLSYGVALKIVELSNELTEMTGVEFTNSNTCIFDILINRFELPILRRNKKGNPSFDKDALELYIIHPEVRVDQRKLQFVNKLALYRKYSTFQSLFLAKYLELGGDDMVLNPSYNQNVRTGRMSCSHPNAQQLNKRAKNLIIPRDGEAFISADASQVEFRIIAHYIQDEKWIKAYNEDPTTDAHSWAGDLAGISRKPGKTLNFAVAFGAGKRKVTMELAADPDIIAMVGLCEDEREFIRLCTQKAGEVYNAYHKALPGIKYTSATASSNCRIRGFVFNIMGRRRHLSEDFAHKAFNSLIQGSASDIVKGRMIEVSPRYNKRIRDWGIRIVAQVHDEILFTGPAAIMYDPEVQAYIRSILEKNTVGLCVPLLWSMGISQKSWAEAGNDDVKFSGEFGTAGLLPRIDVNPDLATT